MQLPTSGHVYFVRVRERAVSFTAAPKILVLVRHINVCDSGGWLPGEASTTGIDEFVVRTDAQGYFTVPPRSFDEVCARVALVPTAYAPGYKSLGARALLNNPFIKDKSAFAGLEENDAILEPQKLSQQRAKDLAQAIHSGLGTIPMSNEILREMAPEMSQLAAAFPQIWLSECKQYDVCGEYPEAPISPNAQPSKR